ncbi:LOW QUALITY PROTEIN: polyhomeotic-like protein 3 [Scomber scombrus]|uniref:LOW QUALITY PROTEIN: polyhomeotic-like protein 3 n=1 Tax=Scomber scombrus TaxID=13677 RepID=UPI002DD9F9E0|nr:LOW QUALITY PROTEIN: polyhomeotic-like protein 3 [Scomber scombrus]
MDRELVRQSQSEHGESTNGTSPQTSTAGPDSSSSAPVTPTPPRLTPNPMLLDSPAPTLTPTTSSPPPPLTPAPSITATHGPKVAAAVTSSPSPHMLVPTPPKLTSTGAPPLRTYSRHILPSSKTSSISQTSSSSSSSSSSPTVATTTSPIFSPSSSTHSNINITLSSKASTTLTNGNTRPISTPTTTPITPFHTPASPPGRQVPQTHPVGTPGLVRANQSPTPVRQRVSQQTLLLGKGLKGSGQDQVLLRAQMLQSLTLRPPPPGAFTIPPSLRLKPPSSTAPPPLSRPHNPLFPPLRPRPSTTATDSLTTPSRHLSVPPPTLYSPVRAVPLRPRLHSPRAASPRQSSTLQPIAAAPAAQALSRQPAVGGTEERARSRPISEPVLGPGQSQHGSLPVTNPVSATSHFEPSPSAARQLQIIALSSGRQPQPGTYSHAPVQPVVSLSELSGQSKRALSSDEVLPLPLNPSLPKTTSPLSSPPSLLSPASPPSQAGPQTQTLVQKGGGEAKESEEQREKGRGVRQGVGDEGSVRQDLRKERDDQREKGKEERQRLAAEKDGSLVSPKEKEAEAGREEEKMEVTEEGQTERERGEEKCERESSEEKKMEEEEEEGETAMDQSENTSSPVLNQHQNIDLNLTPVAVKDLNKEPKPILGLISAPVPVQNPAPISVPVSVPAPVPVPVPVQVPLPEPSVQSQRLPELPRDLQPANQEDFCENMSTQSDNQSALSSLSSQSPPSSPFIVPSTDNPPPLLLPPAQPDHPADLSLPQPEPENTEKTTDGESQKQQVAEAETEEAELIGQSEDESESCNRPMSVPWEPKAWPEGRQVLTHLVEGFVIQEGLQPFPVNRSSLLVPDQVTKPQEVNGTNGKAALPATQSETNKQAEPSTDSEDEGGDTDDPGRGSGHRDRAVLHCQFCGKRGHAHNFMRSKRFCSTSCARGFNVRLTKRLRALSASSRSERPRPALNRAESVPGKPLLLRLPRDLWSAGRREKKGKEKVTAAEEEDEEEDMEGGGEEEDDDGGEEDPAVAMTARMDRRAARRARRASAPAVTTSTPTTTFKPAPSQWSVEEVTSFIHTLPGCSDVAEAFRLQEIDGQALLLLTEDHLMTSMNIKLGPALKICAHINALKNQ